MWFPSSVPAEFERDMRHAQDLGCQGVLGIHWRHARLTRRRRTLRAPAGIAS